MNPATVVFLLQLFSLLICFEVLTRRELPTKHVYKMRFDKPLQYGKYYIGKIGLIRNIVGIILLIVLQNIIFDIKAKYPAPTKTAQEILHSSNEAVRQNNGFIYENMIYALFALIVGLMIYKTYNHYKKKGFSKQPSMVDNSRFDKLEEQAKFELFELMYKQGVLDLPLKPKTINNFEYIKEDQIWIPYPKPLTYRMMLKKWNEEHNS